MRGLAIGAAVLAAALLFWMLRGDDSERTRREREAAGAPAPVERPANADEKTEPRKLVARGRVVTPEREPVADAEVGLFQAPAGLAGEIVRTDADGRFRLAVPDAAYVLVGVRHPGYVFQRAHLTPRDGNEDVIIVMRGAPFTVVVLSPGKRPVAGAAVQVGYVVEMGVAGIDDYRHSDVLAKAVTDAEGRADVGAMPPMDLVLAVDHKSYALHEEAFTFAGLAPVERVVVLGTGGVIAGRVLGPDEAPVAGARVRLRAASRPETRSLADGSYRLEGVGVGVVHVLASADGHGPGYFGDKLGWGEPVPVTMRAGDTLTGIDIVLGRPTFVRGRVLDEKGRPLPDVGASIWAWRGVFGNDPGRRTGADGRFELGPFSVREEAEVQLWLESPMHTFPREMFKTVKPGEDVDFGDLKATRRAAVRGVVIDVGGEPAAGGEVIAHPGQSHHPIADDGTFEVAGLQPGEVFLYAQGAGTPARKSHPVALKVQAGEVATGVEIRLLAVKSIRGRVITPDGAPRASVVLGVRALDVPRVVDRDVVTSRNNAWTGKEGMFEFHGLAEGRYEVGIVGTGSVIYTSGDFEFWKEPPPVRVRAGEREVEFRLPIRGGLVTGRVFSERDRRPLRSFQVTFLRYKLFLPTSTDSEYFDDPRGQFRYELAEPGTWQVEVSAEGYASHRTATFKIKAGETKDLGTIRLGDGGTLAGRVRDAQGRPVPYTRINILNAKLQTNRREPFTDVDGRFELDRISPGLYTVFAVSPRHPIGMARNVTVGEGERKEVTIDFAAPAPLVLTVVDGGGRPIADAELSFTFREIAPITSKIFRDRIPPGYGSHVSDEAGVIRQHSLPPGEVTITIEKPGYHLKTRKLRLKAGETNRVELRLRRKLQ